VTGSYVPTTWVEDVTAVGPTNLNRLERGARDAYTQAHGWFNVMDAAYGAVGDGVTDDSTAIQAADTAAAAVGGVVYFPKATFKTTSVVRPSAGVTWYGPGATIKASVTVADANTGNKSAVSIARGGNCSLVGLKIDGNSTTQVGIELSGYNDGQIQNFLARDVLVTGCTQAGVKIQGGFRHTFDHCRIYSNQIGVWVPATVYLSSLGQWDFHSCWIHDNTAEGVYMQRGDIVNFFGGNVENNGTYGFHFDPSASGQLITGVSVHGVSIEANHTMGLLAHDFTQGLTVVGNYFAASSLQPQAWQLDGAGGGNHFFANNWQTGHAGASVNNSSSSIILPGKLVGESAITGTTGLAQTNMASGNKVTAQAWASGPPSSPADGDIWIATAVDSNGTAWHFRYNSGETTYKWEFIGGPPVRVEVLTDEWHSPSSSRRLRRHGAGLPAQQPAEGQGVELRRLHPRSPSAPRRRARGRLGVRRASA
jgi:hypothetical protein